MGKTTTVVIEPNAINVSAQIIRAHLSAAVAEVKRQCNQSAIEEIDLVIQEVGNFQQLIADNPAKG